MRKKKLFRHVLIPPSSLLSRYTSVMSRNRFVKPPPYPVSRPQSSTGAFLAEPPPQRPWQTGSILGYSPQNKTYTVALGLHGVVKHVRRMLTVVGDDSVFPRGTEVVVSWEIEDRPLIIGLLESRPAAPTELGPMRVTEVQGIGGESGVYSNDTGGPNVRPPNAPTDVIPGDKVFRNTGLNNFIGVLEGGMNVMSSTPMAQVRTHSTNNMVEVMAWLYRHISSMGELKIVNNGGKTSLIWRAGSDQSTETGANQENWTIRLDAGAEGDMFRLAITTPQGNTLCDLHMGGDGKISFTGVGGIDMTSGPNADCRRDVAGDDVANVAGDRSEDITGDVASAVWGSRTTLVGENDRTRVTGNASESVTGNRQRHVSRRETVVVEGGPAEEAEQGNVASQRELVNGGEEVILGNPQKSASTAAQPDYKIVNHGGNVYITVTSGKKVVVMGGSSDCVLLGANGNPQAKQDGSYDVSSASADHHAAMYEELKDWLEAAIDWMDNHTHLTAMGPTGTGAAGTYGPATAKLKSKISPIKSDRVAIGA